MWKENETILEMTNFLFLKATIFKAMQCVHHSLTDFRTSNDVSIPVDYFMMMVANWVLCRNKLLSPKHFCQIYDRRNLQVLKNQGIKVKKKKRTTLLDLTAACQYGESAAVVLHCCISAPLPLEGGGGSSVEDCQKSSDWFEEMTSLRTRNKKNIVT